MPGQVAHLGLGRVVEPTQGQPTHPLFTTQTHLLSNPLLTPPFSVSWAASPKFLGQLSSWSFCSRALPP